MAKPLNQAASLAIGVFGLMVVIAVIQKYVGPVADLLSGLGLGSSGASGGSGGSGASGGNKGNGLTVKLGLDPNGLAANLLDPDGAAHLNAANTPEAAAAGERAKAIVAGLGLPSAPVLGKGDNQDSPVGVPAIGDFPALAPPPTQPDQNVFKNYLDQFGVGADPSATDATGPDPVFASVFPFLSTITPL